MSGWEPLIAELSKYSWRAFVGIFVASGVVLLLSRSFGIAQWEQSVKGYLVLACILSGTISLSYAITGVAGWLRSHHSKFVDLRMVAGSPLHLHWSIAMTPISKKPMLMLIGQMNFAHVEEGSLILKQAYLKGTVQEMPMADIVVNSSCDEPHAINIGVTPVVARPGKALVARLVFVDQFNDKHVSDKITFRPNTLPNDFHAKRLQASPNCVFCGKPVDLKDQALEAQMTAHTGCIW